MRGRAANRWARTVSGSRETLDPPDTGLPRGVVGTAFSMVGSSSSDITTTGVRGAEGSVMPPGGVWAGLVDVGAVDGWAWVNTGSQSSTLLETVTQVEEPQSEWMMTGEWSGETVTTAYSLDKSTSATELGQSASVLWTTAVDSSAGWGYTSSDPTGSYAYAGNGLPSKASALVPVGSDGLAFAFDNVPTTYAAGDYLWACKKSCVSFPDGVIPRLP